MNRTTTRGGLRSRQAGLWALLALTALLLSACSRGGNADPGAQEYSTGTVQVHGYSGGDANVDIYADGGVNVQVGTGTLNADGAFTWQLDVPSPDALYAWDDFPYFQGAAATAPDAQITRAEAFIFADDPSQELLLDHSDYPATVQTGGVVGLLMYSDTANTITLGGELTLSFVKGWNILAVDFVDVPADPLETQEIMLRMGTPADVHLHYLGMGPASH